LQFIKACQRSRRSQVFIGWLPLEALLTQQRKCISAVCCRCCWAKGAAAAHRLVARPAAGLGPRGPSVEHAVGEGLGVVFQGVKVGDGGGQCGLQRVHRLTQLRAGGNCSTLGGVVWRRAIGRHWRGRGCDGKSRRSLRTQQAGQPPRCLHYASLDAHTHAHLS
jgi:hypothetical protein